MYIKYSIVLTIILAVNTQAHASLMCKTYAVKRKEANSLNEKLLIQLKAPTNIKTFCEWVELNGK